MTVPRRFFLRACCRDNATRLSEIRRFIAVVVLTGLTGCAESPATSSAAGRTPLSSDQETIYFVHRGWHTDVGFSADSLSLGRLGQFRSDFPVARYLIFGFGDRHYVLSKDKHVGEMVRALFPDEGLMLVTGLVATPQAAFPGMEVIELRITRNQAARVEQFIWSSIFVDQSQNRPTVLAEGPYSGSLFYRSAISYSALYTCNTWVADALAAGGLQIDSRDVLFSGEISRQVRELPQAQALPPAH